MRHFIFSVFVLFSFSACQDVKEDIVSGADFSFQFTSTYEGSRLERVKKYTYNGYPLEFTVFTLYLSDITLLQGSKEVKISDVEYLDFFPSNASGTLSTQPKITFKNVPEGDYTGIKLGYGVRKDLNKKSPKDFPAGSPLSYELDFWKGWDSYIFCKIEGAGDADKNGSADHFLVYHCGSDPVYKTFTTNKNFSVSASDPTKQLLQIEFDLKKLFTQADGSLYNMVANPATSNDKNDVVVADAIMSRFGTATSIK